MSGQIKRVFLNVSMINRFDGLCKIAKDSGVSVATMGPKDYLIFVNSEKDKVAMLVGAQTPGQRQTMAYTRLEKGRKIDLNTIRVLPRTFDGKSLNYEKALEIAVSDALKQKASKHIRSVGA